VALTVFILDEVGVDRGGKARIVELETQVVATLVGLFGPGGSDFDPADEDPVEPHDAWADDMVLAEGLYRFEQAVSISVTRVEHSWAGLRSFAPDRTPVVGHDPECEGFFWLAGQGGYGVQTAPALSRLTADLVAGTAPQLADAVIAALAPGRFAA